MEHEILFQPTYSLLRVRLNRGESLRAEAGAMVSMSADIAISTEMKGGLFGALKRKLAGESVFMNTFTAERDGEVTLAPPLPGDIVAYELRGRELVAQSGAYIASTEGIEVDAKWGGARSFFAGEGFIMLRLSGSGTVFLSSYGAIYEVELEVGQTYTVDTGHIVAFDATVDYGVKRVGGLKSTLFSGEGLVAEFRGPGKLMIQTRSEDSFLSWLIPRLPKSSGD